MKDSKADLIIEKRKQLGRITLNRPQALNALTGKMIEGIASTLDAWRDDPEVKVIVIDSASPKAFCAGGDIRQIYQSAQHNPGIAVPFFKKEYRLNCQLHDYPKPFVALLDGITMGGGVGVAMHGAFQVATPNFTFAMPETAIGFFPDIAATYLFHRSPHHFGWYLALSGDRINASEALSANLITHTMSAEHLPILLALLVELDVGNDAFAAVANLLDAYHCPLEQEDRLLANAPLITSVFAELNVETILQRLRQQQTDWASAALALLQFNSPTSLKVTFRMMQRAQGMMLPEVAAQDFMLVQHFLNSAEFYEGIRSVVIDKDHCPRWSPGALPQVTEAMVDHYFEPAPEAFDFYNE